MKDLAPIIILSPATRMGTTLVQRLLCSAKDCLIYGDTIGNEAAFLLSWLASKQFALQHQAARHDAMLDAVLSGDTSEFIAELSPRAAGYQEQLVKVATGPLAHCRDEALQHGRPVWGWKLAGIQAWLLQLLPTMLPKARIIHIDRNLLDTARSAKAASHFGEGADFQRFIADAVAARSGLSALAAQMPVLKLGLEELLENPAQAIARLEDFAGCSAIDAGVLGVKVNHPHSPLIPPADLSGDEIAFIRQFEPAAGHVLVA